MNSTLIVSIGIVISIILLVRWLIHSLQAIVKQEIEIKSYSVILKGINAVIYGILGGIGDLSAIIGLSILLFQINTGEPDFFLLALFIGIEMLLSLINKFLVMFIKNKETT